MNDRPELRIADADRERTIAALREHAVAGRLTLEELSDRVGQAYAARTRGELEPLTEDLPDVRPAVPRRRRFGLAVMSGAKWRGRWSVPERSTMVALMGGAEIDLRGAQIEGPEVTIRAIAIMGGVNIVVPPNVEAEVGGFALMGGNNDETRAPEHAAARVRIRAYSLMGGVNVESARRQRELPSETRGDR